MFSKYLNYNQPNQKSFWIDCTIDSINYRVNHRTSIEKIVDQIIQSQLIFIYQMSQVLIICQS